MTQYQRVSIKEDTFGVLGQAPALQLCERHSKLRSTQKFKVSRVVTVQHVNMHHCIICIQKLISARHTHTQKTSSKS